ncbi:MAG TPA: UDP-N-acetylmuramate dehydrogenase [Flavobacteriaceae bacterium]|nr:UDP-N-acetylmuramate dehydrogenase [Flavobacteriaceae bacterium]
MKNLNTFGIDVKAKQLYTVSTQNDLKKILKKLYADEIFVLGGGSNILLIDDLDSTVLHIDLKGISVINESQDKVIIKAMAGENWHQFVQHCIDKDYGGLENLSLIPGNVGTAPMQNIGAYGVELQDYFVECKAINRQTLEIKTFSKEECKFGYRDSVFKNEFKDQFIIISVTFQLSKKLHQLHTSYGSIKQELAAMEIENPTIKDISQAVINIRTEKLPNPNEIGNSGSFFKNPIISKTEFEKLIKKFPEAKYYKISADQYKIPAGWLIDHAGFKGYRVGDAGVHKRQALVLVNYGNATGKQILNLAKKIKSTIKEIYGIDLEMEINVVKN